MLLKQTLQKLSIVLFVLAMTASYSFAQDAGKKSNCTAAEKAKCTAAQKAKCEASKSACSSKAGVKFFKGTWAEALETAQAEGKPIFLDGYASWCGPCQKMIKNTFPQKAVGDYFNANFVNVKMDMEKGEGPEIAAKYGIKNFPTYVFMDSKGNALHRSVGYMEADDFVAVGQAAMNPETQYYTLKNRYKAGERDADFLRNYTMAMVQTDHYSYATEVANEYLATQKKKKLTSEENMEFIMKTPITEDSKAFEVLMANKDKFANAYSAEKVNKKMFGIAKSKAITALKTEDVSKFDEALAFIDTHFGDDADKAKGDVSLMYYQYSNNWDAYTKTAATHVKTHGMDDWNMLNTVAWTYFEKVEDKNALKQAVGWAMRSMELDKNYYNADTYAALLHKVGNNKEAMEAAKVAVELAAEKDMDASATKDMMFDIALDSYGVGVDYILANMDYYTESVGEEKLAKKVGKMLHYRAMKAGKTGDKESMVALKGMVKDAMPENEIIPTNMAMAYHQGAEDWDAYASIAEEFAATEYAQNDWYSLNNMAWTYYEVIDDKSKLMKAEKWVKRSLELEENYFNMDTYAALLYKLGKKSAAVEAANKAIKLAEENDIDPKETKALLSKMESLKP